MKRRLKQSWPTTKRMPTPVSAWRGTSLNQLAFYFNIAGLNSIFVATYAITGLDVLIHSRSPFPFRVLLLRTVRNMILERAFAPCARQIRVCGTFSMAWQRRSLRHTAAQSWPLGGFRLKFRSRCPTTHSTRPPCEYVGRVQGGLSKKIKQRERERERGE